MFNKTVLSFTSILLLSLTGNALAFNEADFEHKTAHRGLLVLEDRGREGMSQDDLLYPYDPVNHRQYEEVMVGKTFSDPNPLNNYSHWRYVTVYNINHSTERVAYLPYFEESCHDDSFFMAQWGESRTLQVTLSSEVKAESLGVSASVSMSITQGLTFSTSRRVKATAGIEAKHYPMKLSDTHSGVTYIQTYNSRTKTYGWLVQNLFRPSSVYPYRFRLNNQNIGFKVRREITKRCPGYDSETDVSEPDTLFR